MLREGFRGRGLSGPALDYSQFGIQMFDDVPKFSGGLDIDHRSDDRAGGASSMSRSVQARPRR